MHRRVPTGWSATSSKPSPRPRPKNSHHPPRPGACTARSPVTSLTSRAAEARESREPCPYGFTQILIPRSHDVDPPRLGIVEVQASSPEYGRMRILQMSETSQIDGPGQSFNAMTPNDTVADRLRPFLNQGRRQRHLRQPAYLAGGR